MPRHPDRVAAAASVQALFDELAALLEARLASSKVEARGRRLAGGRGVSLELRRRGEPAMTIVVEPRETASAANPPVSMRWVQAFARAPRGGDFTPRQRELLGDLLFPRLREALAGLESRLPDSSWRAWSARAAARKEASARRPRLKLTADVLRTSPRDSLTWPGETAGRIHMLRVTFACNQACAFCFVDLSQKMIPLNEIGRRLESVPRARRRTDQLAISGGEPTAHPRLPEITALARAKGFRRIVLQTNAVLLSRPGLVEKLGPLGYYVSFHSHLPRVYDRLTSSRAQFASAVEGLRRILRQPENSLTVNIVVTALNYARLPEHVAFIDRLREGRPVCLFFSMLNDVGLNRTPELAVDLAKARPYLAAAASACLERGLHVASFNAAGSIPVCLFEAPPSLVSRGEWSQDDVRYRDDFAGCDARGKAKSPACKSCAFDRSCQGVPVLYAQRFGLGALAPVRRD